VVGGRHWEFIFLFSFFLRLVEEGALVTFTLKQEGSVYSWDSLEEEEEEQLESEYAQQVCGWLLGYLMTVSSRPAKVHSMPISQPELPLNGRKREKRLAKYVKF
jgi:hypothetical protein